MQFLHPFSKFSFGTAKNLAIIPRNSQYTFGNEVRKFQYDLLACLL